MTCKKGLEEVKKIWKYSRKYRRSENTRNMKETEMRERKPIKMFPNLWNPEVYMENEVSRASLAYRSNPTAQASFNGV